MCHAITSSLPGYKSPISVPLDLLLVPAAAEVDKEQEEEDEGDDNCSQRAMSEVIFIF